MTSEFGAHTQLEKIEMLDVADLVVHNKFEKRGAEDALRAIRKQVKRNRNLFEMDDSALPVIPTIANQFADPGVDLLWERLSLILSERHGMILAARQPQLPESGMPEPQHIIPPERIHYLADISRTVRNYHSRTDEMSQKVRLVQHKPPHDTCPVWRMEQGVHFPPELLLRWPTSVSQLMRSRNTIHPMVWSMIAGYEEKATQYRSGTYTYQVRGRISQSKQSPNLSHKHPEGGVAKLCGCW